MPSSLSTLIVLAVFSVYIVSSQTYPSDDCDEANNCNARGLCATNDDGSWYCICDDGYTTYDAEDDVYCNYEQKKQLTAFLLAWFLGGFGGGQWYLGLTGLAVGKLMLGLSVCCIIPCCGYCMVGASVAADSEGLMKSSGTLIGCCYCCAILGTFVWWLVDIIQFGMNNYEDSNGMELESW